MRAPHGETRGAVCEQPSPFPSLQGVCRQSHKTPPETEGHHHPFTGAAGAGSSVSTPRGLQLPPFWYLLNKTEEQLFGGKYIEGSFLFLFLIIRNKNILGYLRIFPTMRDLVSG